MSMVKMQILKLRWCYVIFKYYLKFSATVDGEVLQTAGQLELQVQLF